MKVLGAILIVLGILGFVLGSVSFTKEEKVADLGGIEIEREETQSFPISETASGVALIAGIILVFVGSRPRDERA